MLCDVEGTSCGDDTALLKAIVGVDVTRLAHCRPWQVVFACCMTIPICFEVRVVSTGTRATVRVAGNLSSPLSNPAMLRLLRLPYVRGSVTVLGAVVSIQSVGRALLSPPCCNQPFARLAPFARLKTTWMTTLLDMQLHTALL